MSMNGLRKFATTLLVIIMIIGLGIASSESASADPGVTVTVDWTRIGIYPKASPSMSAARVGRAVPDGTRVRISCERLGEPVFNGAQTIAIWDRLTDGTWLPNAFLNTGSDTWTRGVPRCSAPSGIVDKPIVYHGEHLKLLGGPLPLAYTLYNHYLWGGGRSVVLEAKWVASVKGFKQKVMSLPVGGFATWSPPKNTDLYWSLGTFTVSHETPKCWAIYDHYDFTPDKLANLPFVVYWAYQLSGARNFDINASGCF